MHNISPLTSPPTGHRPDGFGEPHLSAVDMAQWKLAVATELALPGVMALFPVLMAGRICDFKCLSATPQAAALLGANPEALINRSLRQIVSCTWPAKDLIAACEGVMRGGRETTYVAQGMQGNTEVTVLHHLTRSENGVSMMLSCPLATERRAEAESALRALRAESQQGL